MPSAALHWDSETLTMTLWAVRSIDVDEEITVSYIDILLPYTKRRDLLQNIHGFSCFCHKCTLSTTERNQSDEARAKLRTWTSAPPPERATFSRWFASTSDAANPKTDEERKQKTKKFRDLLTSLLKIYESEQIHAVRAPLMAITDALARLSGALGESTKFGPRLEVAMLTWKQEEAFSVVAQKRLATYERWKEDPKVAFPLWSQRRNSRPDPKPKKTETS
jgi:hypothetical protein